MDGETIIARASDSVSRIFEGRAVVISLEVGRIRSLNKTATHVWSTLEEGPRTIHEIATALAARFPRVPADEIERDVLAFVTDLVKRGVARVVTPRG